MISPKLVVILLIASISLIPAYLVLNSSPLIQQAQVEENGQLSRDLVESNAPGIQQQFANSSDKIEERRIKDPSIFPCEVLPDIFRKDQDQLRPKAILASGTIFKNDTVTLQPWYKTRATLDIPLNNPGNYTITYLDENNTVIGETGFDFSIPWLCALNLGCTPVDSGGFRLAIPDLEGTSKIVIAKGDTVLAERIFSANPPSVTILSPNGGEIFEPGEEINIKWEASDPDGDNLSYYISLSDDGGRFFFGLTGILRKTEFTMRAPECLSNSNLIRVIATDGVNSAEDLSDSIFSFGWR